MLTTQVPASGLMHSFSSCPELLDPDNQGWVLCRGPDLGWRVLNPGSETLSKGSLNPVTGQCGAAKTWSPALNTRPFEGSSQSQNSPSSLSEGLCCNCIPVQLLPLPISAFLLSYRLCSKWAVRHFPAFPFPSQSLFRKPDLRQIRSFSLQLVYKDTKPFWYFPSCNFTSQSVSQ